MAPATPSDNVAGGIYADLIEAQLAQERDRKKSLEQRGMGVVTAAGTLVTLIFAFAAFVHGSGAINLSAVSIGLFTSALFFFICAAIVGILSNRPTSAAEVDEHELERLTGDAIWSWENRVTASQRVAQVKVEMIGSIRHQTDRKADLVLAAVILLAVATILVAATAASVVIHGK